MRENGAGRVVFAVSLAAGLHRHDMEGCGALANPKPVA